jgi:beta-N-acetylhexosaminidase
MGFETGAAYFRRIKRRTLLTGLVGLSLVSAGSRSRRPSIDPSAEFKMIASEMLVVGFAGSDPDSPSARSLARQIRAGEVGGVIFVKENVGDLDDLLGMTRLFSSQSPRKVILAIDHEGGAVQRLVEKHGCRHLPSAQEVAARFSVEEARQLYADASGSVARFGFNLNLAPVVDLENPDNPAIGRFGRCFSNDPLKVAAYARAFVEGFAASGILCALKHFPGQGGALRDSHKVLPDLSAEWSASDLYPFKHLIGTGGIPAVMSGFSLYRNLSVEDLPAVLSPAIVTDLLRQKLGFRGVTITDDLDMGAVGFGRERRWVALQALKAGNDLLVIRNREHSDHDLPASFASWMEEAVAGGGLSRQTLDATVRRIKTFRNNLRI